MEHQFKDESYPKITPQIMLGKMIFGKFTTNLLYVAARLGIADILKHGPKHIDDIAAEAGGHGPSLYRIMRTLSSLGVFMETERGYFALSPMADALRSDSPMSQRDLAIMMGSEFHNMAWADLIHTAKTGRPAFEKRYNMAFFSYLGQNPDDLKILQDCMATSSVQETIDLCEMYDFSGCKKIIDTGGGTGRLLEHILKKYPEAKGVLYDAPDVVESRKGPASSQETGGRLEVIGGDFLESVPAGGDIYILKRVIHDWDDKTSIQILRNCCDAMLPKGKILVAEQVIEPGNEPSLAKIADMEMLVMSSGGKERTLEEFRLLFHKAGLEVLRVIKLQNGSLLEGIQK